MNIEKSKIVFFGTPDFAVVVLESLIKNGFGPISVVTALDKKVGRKQVLIPSPVKKLALKYNIEVFQPLSLKNNPEIVNQLTGLKPDLFILAAYGLILPQEVLDIPQYGCLNIHPSLLPKYRGASPIQTAILNGDKTTGITIIKMDKKVDHGPILARQELEILNPKSETRNKLKIQNSKITYSELSKQLTKLGGELLIKVLPNYLSGEIKPIPQNHSKATFTRRITKQDGRIDWMVSAEYIERMTRAYSPWPGAYSNLAIKQFNNLTKQLKIFEADVLKIKHNKKPGTIFLTREKQLAVACGKDALLLKKVQIEGKKPMSGKDFLNGYPSIVDAILM